MKRNKGGWWFDRNWDGRPYTWWRDPLALAVVLIFMGIAAFIGRCSA